MRINSIPLSPTTLQLVKYGCIGLASNTAGYLIYLLITYLGMPPKTAMTCLYIVGASVGFFGNRQLTFAHDGNIFSAGLRYLLAYTAGYFINLAILMTFVDHLGYPHQVVQAVAIFTVAAFLFLTLKLFVFRTAPQ